MRSIFYKPIKRTVYEDRDTSYSATLIAVGQFNDGHLAYCKCNENGEVEDYDQQYIQVRYNNRLVMERV